MKRSFRKSTVETEQMFAHHRIRLSLAVNVPAVKLAAITALS
jgi:hypothetical protein